MIQKGTSRINGFNYEQISSENPVEKYTADEKQVVEMVYQAMDEAEKRTTKKMKKKEYSDDDVRNQMIQYAFEKWWEDLVYLIECENATWNLQRQSEVYKDWVREDSWWLCQINRIRYSSIVGNPKKNDEQWKKFSTDWKYQIEQCNNLMNEWTPFYWRERMIKWQKCGNYVKSRFILE